MVKMTGERRIIVNLVPDSVVSYTASQLIGPIFGNRPSSEKERLFVLTERGYMVLPSTLENVGTASRDQVVEFLNKTMPRTLDVTMQMYRGGNNPEFHRNQINSWKTRACGMPRDSRLQEKFAQNKMRAEGPDFRSAWSEWKVTRFYFGSKQENVLVPDSSIDIGKYARLYQTLRSNERIIMSLLFYTPNGAKVLCCDITDCFEDIAWQADQAKELIARTAPEIVSIRKIGTAVKYPVKLYAMQRKTREAWLDRIKTIANQEKEPTQPVPITVEALLPPGEWPQEEKGGTGNGPGPSWLDYSRFAFLQGLCPLETVESMHITGGRAYTAFVVRAASGKRLALVDTIVTENALYVFDAEDEHWREDAKKTKRELLSERPPCFLRKIHHNSTWQARIVRLIQEN